MRWDYFYWKVHANAPQNSANLTADIGSPKLSMIFGPWAKTEFFLNGGFGFHSNDVRVRDREPSTPSTTCRRRRSQRSSGRSARRSGPAPPSFRIFRIELTLWYLHLASEQIFDGDHGVTTPSFASHRYGLESANHYTPTKWLTVDADIAYSVPVFEAIRLATKSRARPRWVVSAGAAVDDSQRVVRVAALALLWRSSIDRQRCRRVDSEHDP